MFARSAYRSIQPLKSTVRPYTDQGPARGRPNYTFYALVGVACLGGGTATYYLTDQLAGEAKSRYAAKPNSTSASDTKPTTSTFLGGDQGWLDLKLESVEQINHNTKKFRFALPTKDSVSGLHVASALLTKYQGPQDEKPTIRPYTPTSDEDEKGHLDFVIKKYPSGPMSTHFHDMKPEQRMEFKGPIPKYPWQPNKHTHIALIAGGTGITPMYQLCRAIFNNPDDKTKVTLVFGNITEEDILLKREFENLENEYPQRFRAFYTLDKASDSWTQGKGHITRELLKTVLPEPKTENIKLFICGPPGLYKAISGTKNSPTDQGELSGHLKALGYSQDQVYKF